MVPGFDRDSLNTLGGLISNYERFHLEGAYPEPFNPEVFFDEEEQSFFAIRGLADFWSRQASNHFFRRFVDLVMSAHTQQQADLTFVILGTPQRLAVFISLGQEQITHTLLEGIFPGIQLAKVSTQALSAQIQAHFQEQGVVIGVPGRKDFSSGMKSTGQSTAFSSQQYTENDAAPEGSEMQEGQIERVIRGMYGATWGYIVQAHPRPRSRVIEERMKAVDLLTQITSRSRTQLTTTKQASQQITSLQSGSETQTYSADMVNYRAQYLMRLLERELERLNQASAAGQWTVRTYFGARIRDDVQRMASLLSGTLTGADSHPDPLRVSLCARGGRAITLFETFLTSNELATMIQFPREEVPGYAIHDVVRFDVDFHPLSDDTLPLGIIQQNGRNTYDAYTIALEALTRHVVVVGVTGSGKTTTVMNLLDQAVTAHKPFLVIEPAKTEYRALHSALADRADIRIYTLGNEMVAPFRLNPFEFETDDEPGAVSLLTHIDFLKAVFNAAFILYSPMPHVLEEALHEVYEDKGWDLTSGVNLRVPDWSERHRYPIFPTLTDLYYKVEEVTNRLGYDEEVESNIKAGLKARIGSLRVGSKGLMLDTARGVPLAILLSQPTILELENIGSDDEKTFIMGLFLARLYEYRRLQAATGTVPPGLQHLIVFEEAHRLLKNTPTQVDSESSNMRAQAIEVFTNMLSEVRAYGQGVLVAEQIPSKLAPDVLKNTNLKIVHRLIAQDDRQSIGQTMNLNREQQTHLGILMPGMAAVYAEGADHAYLVRMENYKRKLSPLTDAQLKLISPGYASVASFQDIPDLALYAVPLTPLNGPEPAFTHMVEKVLATEKSRHLWARIALSFVTNPGQVLGLLLRFTEIMEEQRLHLTREQQHTVLRMIIVRGCYRLLHDKGVQAGWSYALVDELRESLTHGMLLLLQAHTETHTVDKTSLPAAEAADEEIQPQQILEEARPYLDHFAATYMPLLHKEQGPFTGCTYCPVRCTFRTEVNTLLTPRVRAGSLSEMTNATYDNDAQRCEMAFRELTHSAQSWLGHDESLLDAVSFCALQHVLGQGDFTDSEQMMISAQIADTLSS
ncbi:ATP-binding protein [Ktedonobacteria bacterium brp13]|nr:ATP-binding protein [Ktedonobacteria bacterium brp13]